MKIHLIRHGSTKLNHQDRIRGWSDPELSEEGHREVEETARKLIESGIELIVSSDLTRAQQTALAVKEHTGARMEITDKLRPWNVGHFTGQESKDVHPKMREYARTPDERIPKGESLNEFRQRFFEGLAEAIASAGKRKLCIVTHHRGERLIKAWIAKGSPAGKDIDLEVFFRHGEPPANAEIVEIDDSRLSGGPKGKAIINKKK